MSKQIKDNSVVSDEIQIPMEEVKEVIALVKERKKLNRWNVKYIDEDSLPPLYLQNGEMLDKDMIRFLFYRMKQMKVIESDVEAKLLLNHIDKNSSNAFAL